jgi:D-lactate dehydrogenase
MAKIIFFEIKDWEKEYLLKRLAGHELFFGTDVLDAAKLTNNSYDIVSVFIYSKINQAALKALPQLKLVATRSTGFDHIDLEACSEKKITVCNVPFYGENTVAEHTFALILSLSRNVHKAYVKTLGNNFSLEGLKGFDLKDKTLGVVGAGHIGLHVIRIAKGFGMRVVAFDVNQDKFLAEVLGFEYLPFEEVLKQSDIVSLHVPDNQHTHHLINRQNIELFKKGSMLINTARGGVVDTEALLWALENGVLAGAGLDVLEGEEFIKEEKQLLHAPNQEEALASLVRDHLILKKDNVVFTPHIAFYSQEALERILETTAQNIEAFIADKPLNLVKV